VRGIDADADPVSVASPTPRPAIAPVLMNSRRPISFSLDIRSLKAAPALFSFDIRAVIAIRPP
jgi:hypothetical protein